MTTANTMYQQAEVALAAYASLSSDIDGRPYTRALEEVGMSPTQAAAFASRWRVVEQYDGVVAEQMATYDDAGDITGYVTVERSTGLSVTLFQEVTTDGTVGRQVVAVRGTELLDLRDWATNIIDVALLGTPERQAQYAALSAKVGEWLGAGTLQSGFEVTGHSLGGFLAGALLVDYPIEVGHAYLYNAPGVGGLRAGLRLLTGAETQPTLELSRVSNLIAQAGPSVAAGVNVDWGAPVPVFIEDRFPNLVGNHYMVALADALAVYDLFARLDPDVSVDTVTAILKGVSKDGDATLETAIAEVGAIFGKKYPRTAADDHEVLYANLKDLDETLKTTTAGLLKVTDLTRFRAQALVFAAREDIAYRYALVEGNAFALSGDAAIYDPHNAHGELTLFDPATGTGELTNEYLSDRAEYLVRMLDVNEADGSALLTSPDGKTWRYHDVTDNRTIIMSPPGFVQAMNQITFGSDDAEVGTMGGGSGADRLYGMGGDDEIHGGGGDDYIEGNRGNDRLRGGAHADHLLGGSGDDVLIGGTGNDILEGGTGHDTYVFNSGDGSDVIRDADGLGRIVYDGVVLTGGAFARSGHSLALEIA